MLRTLLAKDLRRACRNPVPWLVSLGVAFLITTLVGLAFGPAASGGGFGRIKLGLVDQDNSALTRFLRGALDQQQATKYLELHYLKRAAAMHEIDAGKLAAVVIIPKGFTRDYLTANRPVKLELIKNPAGSIHPAMVQEMLATLVTGLNAVSRNLQAEFPGWRRLFEDDQHVDLGQIGRLLEDVHRRLQPARAYFPPLITYEKETRAGAKARAGGITTSGMFAFLQLGMAGMFLLFMADHALRDFYRELKNGTLARYRTAHEGLLAFVTGKMVHALVIIVAGAVILLGGAAVAFRFRWQHPAALMVLVAAYALFCAGLMGFIAALAGQERRADVLNNLVVMTLSLAGGCMFPPQQLPAFVRDHLTTLMPTAWFVEAARGLQFGGGAWMGAAAKLAIVGCVLVVATAVLFRRRLLKGVR